MLGPNDRKARKLGLAYQLGPREQVLYDRDRFQSPKRRKLLIKPRRLILPESS